MQVAEVVPILRIFDEDAAREFYIDFLGFSVDWEHRFGENMPLYMQVSLNGCTLHLTGHHGDCTPGSRVYIRCEGIEAYQQTLIAKEYKHARPGCPERTPWNSFELTLADPFGNRLTFAEALDDA